MAMPGPPPSPLFGSFPDPQSATPSTIEVSPEARFLSDLVDRTRDVISLSPEQVQSLSPAQCDDLSQGESAILPLLCATIHAISSLGHRIEEIHTSVQALQSQVANSPVDDELRQLRNAVRDLSHRMITPPPRQGAPAPAQSRPPPPPPQTPPSPSTHPRPTATAPN